MFASLDKYVSHPATIAVRYSSIAIIAIAQIPIAAAPVDGPRDIRYVIRDAERFLQLGQVGKARQLLQARADALGSDAPLSSGYHRVTLLLAQAYVESGQNDRAQVLATSCRDYLARIPNKSSELTTVQQDADMLRASAYENQNAWKKAAECLTEARELDQTSHQPNPARRIELLKRWGQAWALAGDARKLDEATSDIQASVKDLESSYVQHSTPLKVYDQAVSALARLQSEQGRTKEAVRQWQRLLTIYETANNSARQAEIWTELAAAYKRSGDDQGQISSLEQSAVLWEKDAERFASARTADTQPQMLARFQIARAHRKLAEALNADAQQEKRTSSLHKASKELEALQKSVADRQVQLKPAEGGDASDAKVHRVSEEESQVIDSFKLSVLQELRAVRELSTDQKGDLTAGGDEDDLRINQEIHDLRSKLYPPDDARIYAAKLQLGALLTENGKFSAAQPYLVAANDYWRRNLSQQTLERAQIADLLATCERQLGWNSASEQRQKLLSQAQSRLVEVLPISKGSLAASHPKVLIKLELNFGRLCFELGDTEQAEKVFEDAISLAQHTGDETGELRALEFKRALSMATIQYPLAAHAQSAIDALAARAQGAGPETSVAALISHADISLASQQLEAAEQQLDQAAAICPDGPFRARLDQDRAVAQFLRIGRAVGAQQSLVASNVPDAREYWLSLVQAKSGEASAGLELRQSRAFYYLSRLRYLEWHDARRHWASVYVSPTLGRSASYDERREKHKKRCEQYAKDAEEHKTAVDKYRVGNADPKVRSKLDDRARQLQTEFESIKEIGARLSEEQKAKSLNQAQLAGRAARDLAQLLTEAETYADRSVEIMQKLSSGQGGDYDPNLHYLALSNQVEIQFAQIVTTTWDSAKEGSTNADYQRMVTRAIDILEKATGLMTRSELTKLGGRTDSRYFFRGFDQAPSVILRSSLESSLGKDEFSLQAVERLHELAKREPVK